MSSQVSCLTQTFKLHALSNNVKMTNLHTAATWEASILDSLPPPDRHSHHSIVIKTNIAFLFPKRETGPDEASDLWTRQLESLSLLACPIYIPPFHEHSALEVTQEEMLPGPNNIDLPLRLSHSPDFTDPTLRRLFVDLRQARIFLAGCTAKTVISRRCCKASWIAVQDNLRFHFFLRRGMKFDYLNFWKRFRSRWYSFVLCWFKGVGCLSGWSSVMFSWVV